jgi:hypothetical protein
MVCTGEYVQGSSESVATSKRNRCGSIASAIRSLTDAELVEAMRQYQPVAWTEFHARFRPVLEHYAERSRIPETEWSVCIGEVLSEESVRLTARPTTPPRLTGYLIRAVRHRWLRMRRESDTRHRLYRYAANDPESQRPVVQTVVSEATRRAANDPTAVPLPTAGESAALRHWIMLVRHELTQDEIQLLQWAAELVPRPVIAEWLGIGYHAARKRVTRAMERARALARACERHLPPEEREEVRRLLRRAGALPDDAALEEPSGRQSAGEG